MFGVLLEMKVKSKQKNEKGANGEFFGKMEDKAKSLKLFQEIFFSLAQIQSNQLKGLNVQQQQWRRQRQQQQ